MALRPVAKKVDFAAEVLDGCAVPRGGVGLELEQERCQVSPKNMQVGPCTPVGTRL
jgi:hypothetical protein